MASDQDGGGARIVSSALRQIPTQAFHLYRRTRVGLALLDNLALFMDMGTISPALAYAILQQFDYSVVAVTLKLRSSYDYGDPHLLRFSADRVLCYRILDGLVACVLRDVVFYQLLDPDAIKPWQEEQELFRKIRGEPTPKKRRRKKKQPAEAARPRGRSGGGLLAVRLGTASHLVVLSHNPFAQASLTSLSGLPLASSPWAYEIHTHGANRNPRMEFFTYVERRRPETAVPQLGSPSTHSMELRPRRKKRDDDREGKYDPRALATRMGPAVPPLLRTARSAKESAFWAKPSYWRGKPSAGGGDGDENNNASGRPPSSLSSSAGASPAPWSGRGGGGGECKVRFSRPKRLTL